MPAAELIASRPAAATSLRQKLVDLFVTPGEVFAEVAAAPPNLANWLVPTTAVCLFAVFWPAAPAAASLPRVCAAVLGSLGGTVWSAFVLWMIGHVFLRARFSFRKSLEVVGLSGMILILGGIVTGLLVMIWGNDAARPAFSLLFLASHRGDHLRHALDSLNVFHLWTTGLLAIGLSRLSGVSVKEAAFWTFGYWIAVRIALALLV